MWEKRLHNSSDILKNSFRIGLPHEKSDVQRAASGAQSELCGVALVKCLFEGETKNVWLHTMSKLS